MQQPWVIMLTGAPGSGKSTTGLELARRLGAALLDQDSMTNPLVDVVARQLGVADYADPHLAEAVRGPRYEALLQVARDCAGAGVPAVLVAPFTSERRSPRSWEELALRISGWGARPWLVWLRIGAEELVRRVRARGAERDGGKLADPQAWVGSLDLAPPTVPHVEVDAALAPQEQVAGVLAALGASPRPSA